MREVALGYPHWQEDLISSSSPPVSPRTMVFLDSSPPKWGITLVFLRCIVRITAAGTGELVSAELGSLSQNCSPLGN